MSTKIILVVLGEPNSTFSEILLKFSKSKLFKKINKRIILIGNYELFKKQMIHLNFKVNLNKIRNIKNALDKTINMRTINLYSFFRKFI